MAGPRITEDGQALMSDELDYSGAEDLSALVSEKPGNAQHLETPRVI